MFYCSYLINILFANIYLNHSNNFSFISLFFYTWITANVSLVLLWPIGNYINNDIVSHCLLSSSFLRPYCAETAGCRQLTLRNKIDIGNMSDKNVEGHKLIAAIMPYKRKGLCRVDHWVYAYCSHILVFCCVLCVSTIKVLFIQSALYWRFHRHSRHPLMNLMI